MDYWNLFQMALQDPSPTVLIGLPDGVKSPLENAPNTRICLYSPEDCHTKFAEEFGPDPQNLVVFWDTQLASGVHKRYSFLQIALMTLFENLARGSRILTFVPQYYLSSCQAFRDHLCRFGWLRLVVDVDGMHDYSGRFESSVATSMSPLFRICGLVFELSSPSDKSATQFFQLPAETPFQEAVKQLDILLKSQRGKCKFGFSKHPPVNSDISWLPEFHSPVTRKREGNIGQLGRLEELGQLARFVVGKNSRLQGQKSTGKPRVRAIRARDIPREGALDVIALDDNLWECDGNALMEGDFIIKSHIMPTEPLLRLYEVESQSLPLLAGSFTIGIRLDPSLKTEERAFLRDFLKSQVAMQLLRTRGLNMDLTVAILSQLPVPVPSEQVIASLQAIEEAKSLFENWRNEAVTAQNDIFRDALKDPLVPLLATGRRLRQITEAGRLVDDPSHRIRTLYPFPIAYRWRQVEGSRPDLEGYVQVLEAAEVSLCFLASVSVAVGWSSGKYLPKKCVEIQKAFLAKKGVTMGDWTSLLHECAGNRATFKSSALQEILDVWVDDETNALVKNLLGRRNDQAHGRGPKSARIKPEFEATREKLLSLLQRFDCLTDYPLRFVESTKRDSIRRTTNYDYRDLLGDHDVVPIRSGAYNDPDLEAGSLYLVDRDSTLHLLRPMLSRLRCEECGNWSTFQLDGPGPRLKSLEHGHSMIDPTSLEAFAHLGFFPG